MSIDTSSRQSTCGLNERERFDDRNRTARSERVFHPVPFRRRDVLQAIGVALAGLAVTGGVSDPAVATLDSADEASVADDENARTARLKEAYAIRNEAAAENTIHRAFVAHPTNGDETGYDSKLASYSKGLPHDEFGHVDLDAYATLVDAIEGTGEFSAISLAGTRLLENPEATFSFNITGYDPNDVFIEPPPAFASAETAAEMVELYWQALARDVDFREYEEHPLTIAAAEELSGLEEFRGPTEEGTVTTGTLFRGDLAGTQTGPYVSQFLYKDVQRGMIRQDQKVPVATPDLDFVTEYDTWLDVQNGQPPSDSEEYAGERYILTGRDLASYVHRDTPHQPFLAAALMLLDWDVPFGDGNPYNGSSVQSSFIDYGVIDVIAAVTGIVADVQHAIWYHKWQRHRRLRPETFGGHLHNALTGAGDAPIHPQLLESEAVARTRDKFGTYLLPQAYPEGSPMHPSFPAGHAGIAGACATVLKAYFDGSAPIPDPVEPTDDGTELEPIEVTLTVEHELDKLADNFAMARDLAGIHYRSDASHGLRMGERFAIGWLRDRLRIKAAAGSFTFTTFDGDVIRIKP